MYSKALFVRKRLSTLLCPGWYSHIMYRIKMLRQNIFYRCLRVTLLSMISFIKICCSWCFVILPFALNCRRHYLHPNFLSVSKKISLICCLKFTSLTNVFYSFKLKIQLIQFVTVYQILRSYEI